MKTYKLAQKRKCRNRHLVCKIWKFIPKSAIEKQSNRSDFWFSFGLIFKLFIIHQRSDFIIHCSLRKSVLMNDEYWIMKSTKSKIRRFSSADFRFWSEWQDLTVCCGYALHTDRLATQILMNFGTRQPLCAKNNSPNCFLNAQTFTGSSPYFKQKNWEPAKANSQFLVGVTGLEPAASWPPVKRAPSCATPRYYQRKIW